MSSSYSSVDLVLSHWAISLCLDSFVFMFVFFCVYLVMLHMCCIIVTRWVDLVGLKPDPGPYLPSVL